MNTSYPKTRQPLSQIDFNQEELSNRGATPTAKQQFKTTTLNSDSKSNYNVQFKVSAKQQQQPQQIVSNSSRLNENNSIFMSPMPVRRNTQIQVQQGQIRSPLQKNYSQAHLQPIPTSPITKPAFQFRGVSQQQNNISHTTTQQLQNEVITLKDTNNMLQQQVLTLESQITRGNSTTFIKELENKIIMLQKLNEKLNLDNQQLLKLSDIESLKKQKNELEQSIKNLQNQQLQIQQQFEQYDCETLQKLINQEDTNINELVNDLEQKIQGLIIENDNLNSYIQENDLVQSEIESLQLEVQTQQLLYQKSKNDEVQFRYKYDQALQENKILKKPKKTFTSLNIENMLEKVKLIEEENEKLQQLINDQDYEGDIKDLEDRITLIAENNRKLEKILLEQQLENV